MGTGPPRVTDRHRELARSAREKKRRGQPVNRQEAAALERVTDEAELSVFLRRADRMPKWLWVKWSNRQHKTIGEMAERYGMPALAEEVSLPTVIRWLYDFLAANARKLSATEGEDPMSGELSPALERWREEKWRLARLERQEREETLVVCDVVHDGLAAMAGILRGLAETMQRHFGPEAHQLVDEAIDDWERELARQLDTNDRDDDNPSDVA
jgi:hypothetical protein